MGDTPQAIAYEVALRRLDSQMSNVDIIENKAGVVLGLASTLIAIFVGALALAADDLTTVAVATPFGVLILVLYVRIMGIGLKAISAGDWDERPSWDHLLDSASELDLESMQLWVARGCILSLQTNAPKVKQKAKGVNRAIELTAWYLALIAAALFAVFVVGAVQS